MAERYILHYARVLKYYRSGGAIAGLVIGLLVAAAVFIVILVICVKNCNRRPTGRILRTTTGLPHVAVTSTTHTMGKIIFIQQTVHMIIIEINGILKKLLMCKQNRHSLKLESKGLLYRVMSQRLSLHTNKFREKINYLSFQLTGQIIENDATI